MATIAKRSLIIRSEVSEAQDSWLSDESFDELSLDAILLVVCLIVFALTRFGMQHSKSKAKARKDPPSDVPVPDRSTTSRITHPACTAPPIPLSHERLVLALLQPDDRQPGKVIDTYRQCRERVEWNKITSVESEHIFFNLCVAAARLGSSKVLNALLRDMERLDVPRSSTLYTTLLKLHSSKRLFHDTLALWEHMRADKVQELDRAAWSCLLFAATEAQSVDQAKFFFERLIACGGATEKDFGNMIRSYASRHEGREAVELLDKMRAQGMEPDTFTYNAVFSACCAGGKDLDLCEQLFSTMKSLSAGVDAITYNTLLKSYVQAKRLDKAFRLVNEMESEAFSPTEVTFGTLLDACINDGSMDRAQEVFQKMKAANCEMNTVLYTTMIKGFVKMNKLDEVLFTFKEMQSQGVEADGVTYSLVLKALCAGGQLEAALDLFNSICAEGHKPDEIIFNNLLSGCVTCKNVALGERILHDMVKLGIKPTCATFSTLIKLYSECNALPQAVHLVEQMEVRYGCVPEQRLHWQLLHACLRMRQRQSVVDVFEALIKRHGAPDIMEVQKLLKSCINFNMLDFAAQFAKLSLSSGARVSSKDLQAIVDAALKKRKLLVVDSIAELSEKYGLCVSSH